MFAGKRLQLELIILSKRSQSHRDKWCILFAPLWTLDFIHTQNHIFTSDLKVEARLSGEQRRLKGVGTRDKRVVVGYEELCLKHIVYLDHNDLVQLNIIIIIIKTGMRG